MSTEGRTTILDCYDVVGSENRQSIEFAGLGENSVCVEGMTELLVSTAFPQLDSYSQGDIKMRLLPSRVHARLTNHLEQKPSKRTKFPGLRMLRHQIWSRIPFLFSHLVRL
jgi:hypothetical protein